MPAGRPTDYSDSMLEKANEYLESYAQEESIPQVASLALHLGIARSTVYKWAGEEGKERFSDIVDDILAKQEQVLFSKGLSGEFNPSITKLALTKHGYSDKQQQELSGPNGGPQEHKWQVEVVDATPDKE